MTDAPRKKFTGRDLAEAMIAACEEFGVPRNHIGHEIISSPSRGAIESIDDLNYVVEAWVLDEPMPVPVNDPPRGRLGDRDRGRGGGPRDRGRGGGRSFDRDRDRDGDRDDEPMRPLKAMFDDDGEQDPVSVARTLVGGLVDGLDLKITVDDVSEGDAGLVVNLDGEDADTLTEERGEGLEALQTLANRMLFVRRGEPKKIWIDADGYRQSKVDAMINKARELADKVKAGEGVQQMPPMGPFERRQVHIELAKIDGIKSFSTGQGRQRRLQIAIDE